MICRVAANFGRLQRWLDSLSPEALAKRGIKAGMDGSRARSSHPFGLAFGKSSRGIPMPLGSPASPPVARESFRSWISAKRALRATHHSFETTSNNLLSTKHPSLLEHAARGRHVNPIIIIFLSLNYELDSSVPSFKSENLVLFDKLKIKWKADIAEWPAKHQHQMHIRKQLKSLHG